MDSWLDFRRNRVILNQWTKWNNRSLKLLPKNVFHRASSHQIRNYDIPKKICQPTFIQTWLHQYSRGTFFYPAHCFFRNSICFWSVRRRRAMIPGKIITRLANPKEFCVKWLKASSSAPRAFASSFRFLVKFLYSHGYAWIHWVAKSCTTIAHRWLFRDSQLSLRTLWCAVIKSPKFSARGTAPPLRLLHGAL